MSKYLKKSLDDIIKDQKLNKQITRKPIRKQDNNKFKNQIFNRNPQFKQEKYKNTIIVSNLEKNILQNDLKVLFSTCGELKQITIDFGPDAISTGIAKIQFKTSDSAHKAINEYNGSQIDGQIISIKNYI